MESSVAEHGGDRPLTAFQPGRVPEPIRVDIRDLAERGVSDLERILAEVWKRGYSQALIDSKIAHPSASMASSVPVVRVDVAPAMPCPPTYPRRLLGCEDLIRAAVSHRPFMGWTALGRQLRVPTASATIAAKALGIFGQHNYAPPESAEVAPIATGRGEQPEAKAVVAAPEVMARKEGRALPPSLAGRENELRALLLEKPRLTVVQIGERLGLGHSTIDRGLYVLGLSRRSTSDQIVKRLEGAGHPLTANAPRAGRAVFQAEPVRESEIVPEIADNTPVPVSVRRRCQAIACNRLFRPASFNDLCCPACVALHRRVEPGADRSQTGNSLENLT